MTTSSDQQDNITYANVTTITGGQLADIKPEQRDKALKGAQILARCLQLQNVDTLFGYPGGANLEIFDVLRDFNIRCIRTEHEQGAVHAAQGYARATGKVGVCLATSGPGATNLVTGLADANSDSTPVVAITGNVPSHLLGKNAFQEVDIVAITQVITKKNYLLKRVADIPEVVSEAFIIAGGNRPGPVLIDIPKDIQQQYPRDPDGNYAPPRMPAIVEPPEKTIAGISDTQLQQCQQLIADAERPVIYAGGGITGSDSAALLLQLAEHLSCPVTTTIMGWGTFPPAHPLALHIVGMHGSRYANVAINEADLVLALGVRFDDRVTGNPERFIEHGNIIHIDIDARELNKNKPVTLPVCADIAQAMAQLLAACEAKPHNAWNDTINDLRQQYPMLPPPNKGNTIKPQYAIRLLSDITEGKAIVSLGVGQHQMWAMQHYQSQCSRSFLSSSGFGTMGYGLPAALGAKIACPERQVIDIDGDGSLNMTIHELATCHRYQVGVKIVVINNQWLGMVRQWQDMIYDGHRSGTDCSDPLLAVKPDGETAIYPDFVTIAQGYRVTAERVTTVSELAAAFERLLANPEQPYLLDVIVDAEENVYPMIPAGGSYRDIIMDKEDLKPSAKESQGSHI